jgi:hypothetical protein
MSLKIVVITNEFKYILHVYRRKLRSMLISEEGSNEASMRKRLELASKPTRVSTPCN